MGVLEALEDQRSVYAIQRASAFASWVHRRIETFEFPEADTIRRRMSVDFTMPEARFSDAPNTVPIPLMILKKIDLKNFDIVDSEGRSLQTFTSQQNGTVARRGLESLLSEGWHGEREELREALRSVLEEPEAERAMLAAYRELSTGGRIDTALGGLAVQEATKLSLRALIKELAVGFMLMVERAYEPGRRDLVKFSYDARIEREREFSPLDFGRLEECSESEIDAVRGFFRLGSGRVISLSRAYRWMMRNLSRLGLVARQEDFEGLQLGWSASYHAELVPPADMWVAETSLEPEGEPSIRSRDKFRPHLRVGARPRESTGQLTVLLHPQMDALIVPLVLSAAVISAALAFVPHRLGSLDGQTFGALLVLPFALAAFYVRSSEHRYVTDALRLLRVLAMMPVLAGLLILAMLGLGFLEVVQGTGAPADPDAVTVAEWAAKAAATATVFLTLALITPSVGIWLRERIIRNVERWTKKWPGSRQSLLAAGLVIVGLLGYVVALKVVLEALYSVLSV